MTLEFEREDVVQKLCAAYARDQLTTGELEARLERVYKSADRVQLNTVLEGLPAMQIARLGEVPAPVPNVAPPPYRTPQAAAHTPPGTPSARGERRRGRGLGPGEKRYAAFMSEIRKEGAWTVTPTIVANTVMGGVVLDFRETPIPAEGVDIYADVIMGSLKVILPPGLGADVDCSTFLGSVNDKSKAGVAGAPTIRVTGSTVMGDITVVTKVPRKQGESAFREQMRRWLGSGE
jgi:hypothetical protein